MSLQQSIAKALNKEVQKGNLTAEQANQLLEEPRNNKYGVAPSDERTLDGIVFDSKAEMNRYAELVLLKRAGIITNLQLQPKFILKEKGRQRAIYYVADFRYWDTKLSTWVVEDVKGVKTSVYRMKKKLFLEKYPDVVFREVR
jgi:hypothetical protein